MKRCSRWLIMPIYLLLVLFPLYQTPASANDTTQRVLILPFAVHAEQNLAFLNKGIEEMLTSRIGQAAKVVVDPNPAPEKAPLQLGREVGAHFVATGSITLFGVNVSTDARLTRIVSGETVLHFSRFGQSKGDVLEHVNQFGSQVAEYLTSLTKPTRPEPQSTEKAMPIAKAPKQPSTSTPSLAASNEPSHSPAPQGLAPTPPETETSSKSLWVSERRPGTINALSVADVNADGRPDIVVAQDGDIVVETPNGRHLVRQTVFNAGKNNTIIAVDAGDLNGNHVAEIFVTRLNAHGKLDSMVLEWNGSKLRPIASRQPWYFRLANDPEKKPVLVGQRQGRPSANDTGGLYTYRHFLPGIFELLPEGSGYQTTRRLALPTEQCVYGFAQGDLLHDGQIRTVAFSPADKLRVFDATGTPQWAGNETLGGSPLFLESISDTDIRTKDRTYLSQRLEILDIDGDGLKEIVTVHNHDMARGMAERFRKYTHGRMVVLSWNGVNMKEIWSGEDAGGHISDFAVADLNDDGILEAVYGMIENNGLFKGNISRIVIEPFDLPFER